ncbi:MAG: sensor histidine kinase [Bacillales bacterium]|jgi:two-component system sensor histidine kinase VanS|nr:sensor histidine kinase [Bacillales bacterium]
MKKIIYYFQKSVSFKIFLVTSAMLVLTTGMLYGVIFFVLPPYYKTYKISQLEDGIAALKKSTQKGSLTEKSTELENFAEKYNVAFKIYDLTGSLVYQPKNFFRISNGMAFIETDELGIHLNEEPEMSEIQKTSNQLSALHFASTIIFTDGVYMIEGNTSLQPINEASRMLWQFIPFIGIYILLVAVIAGIFLSKMISKPLVQLNSAATKMAELDFSVKIPVKSEDEIGQLSESFNEMSRNLQTALIDLKSANEHLKEDMEKERKIEEKRREFVATVSHELKSPITAVKGQLEGMIYGIGVYKDKDTYLKKSYSKLEEMEALVKEMLEVSRLDRPDFNPKLNQISLDKLVRNLINKQEFFLREKRMNLETSILENVWIKTDENLLGKVIQNIIHNAISYTLEEETIRVLLEDDVDQYVLSVLNTGAKIDADEIEDIFRPFYRLDKSRNRNLGGSGLGLYIVKRFLDTLQLPFKMETLPEGVKFTIFFKKTA